MTRVNSQPKRDARSVAKGARQSGRYRFNGNCKFNSNDARLKERAGGRYKFICNCNGNDNGNRNVNCLVLDFCAHAAYYVVYCDVADWMLGAINYCQAAQIVFVENFEDVFVVGVGRY